jgi:ketosteroid isomerase-like protein
MSLDETPAAIKPAESPVPATTAKPLDIADAPQAAKVTETKQLPESIGRVGIESTHVAEAPVETKLNVAIPPKPDRIAAVSDVAKELTGWLAAWSEKNVDAYLAYYAKDFQTPGGESRAAWESERASRINKPGAIQVTYENLQITIDGNFATAKFRQHYKSNRLKTGTSKVVVLANRDGRWLIQQERIGK